MRIGVDLGGTKIEIAALGDDGAILLRERVAAPQDDYAATIRTVKELVDGVEARLGARASVGIGTPGTISPASGLMKNSNSTWLNGKPLDRDLAAALGRQVRTANDANCFALSEAADGAAAGKRTVFGVIVGTGVGGGVVVDGRVLVGPHGVAGEWGHMPLPWPRDDERPGSLCYCGKMGCIETFLSGPGLVASHKRAHGERKDAHAIAAGTDAASRASMERWFDRFARALAVIVDILDPDAIVIGGGLSNIEALYRELPHRVPVYVFSDVCTTPILKNQHGDSGGVRGAAWLWREDEAVP